MWLTLSCSCCLYSCKHHLKPFWAVLSSEKTQVKAKMFNLTLQMNKCVLCITSLSLFHCYLQNLTPERLFSCENSYPENTCNKHDTRSKTLCNVRVGYFQILIYVRRINVPAVSETSYFPQRTNHNISLKSLMTRLN